VNDGDDILDSETAGTQNVCQVVLNPTIDAVSPDDCPHVNHFDVFPDEVEFVYNQFYKTKFRPSLPISLSPSFDGTAHVFEISHVYGSE
jgi:hypothetical protein